MPRSRSRSRSRSRERHSRKRTSSSSHPRGTKNRQFLYKNPTEGFYQTEHWPPFILIGDSRVQSLIQICRTPPPHRWMPEAKTAEILEMVEEELKERGDEFEVVVIFALQNDMLRYKKQKNTGDRALSANQYFTPDKSLMNLQHFFAKMKSKYPHIVFILTLPYFFNFTAYNRCRGMKVHVSAYQTYERLQLELRQYISTLHRQFQYLDLQRSYEIAQFLDGFEDPTLDGLHPTCSLAKRIMQGIYNSLLYAKKHHMFSNEDMKLGTFKRGPPKKLKARDYSPSSYSSASRSRSRSRSKERRSKERTPSKSPPRSKEKPKSKSTCYLYYRRSPSPDSLKKHKTLAYYNRGLKIELEEGEAKDGEGNRSPGNSDDELEGKDRSRSREEGEEDSDDGRKENSNRDKVEQNLNEDHRGRTKRKHSHPSADGFSIKRTFDLLEEVQDNYQAFGPSTMSFVTQCQEKGPDSMETLAMIQSSEGKLFLKMIQDALASEHDLTSDSTDVMLIRANKWAKKVLSLANKNIETLSFLDFKSIAEGTKGAETSYIIDFIKSALVYEGLSNPPKEILNKAYLTVCALHVDT